MKRNQNCKLCLTFVIFTNQFKFSQYFDFCYGSKYFKNSKLNFNSFLKSAAALQTHKKISYKKSFNCFVRYVYIKRSEKPDFDTLLQASVSPSIFRDKNQTDFHDLLKLFCL